MRVVVARQFERIGLVAAGDQRQRCIAFERTVQIAQFAPGAMIDTRGECGLGQSRPDRRGDIRRGGARRHFAHRAIRKADLEKLRHRLTAMCGAALLAAPT